MESLTELGLLAGERWCIDRALSRYEETIKAVLQSACNRTWGDGDLYATAQITANAITWRDREIAQLKQELEEEEDPAEVYMRGFKEGYKSGVRYIEESNQAHIVDVERLSKENSELHRLLEQKTLVFDESCNVPCTAELEVKLGELVKLLEDKQEYWNNTEDGWQKGWQNGASHAYGRSAELLRDTLGWDKR